MPGAEAGDRGTLSLPDGQQNGALKGHDSTLNSNLKHSTWPKKDQRRATGHGPHRRECQDDEGQKKTGLRSWGGYAIAVAGAGGGDAA